MGEGNINSAFGIMYHSRVLADVAVLIIPPYVICQLAFVSLENLIKVLPKILAALISKRKSKGKCMNNKRS